MPPSSTAAIKRSFIVVLLSVHNAAAVVLRPALSVVLRPSLQDPPPAFSRSSSLQASLPMDTPLQTLMSTRVLVSGAAFGVLLWRHDTASVLCVTGAVLNAIFGKVLKRLINEARPEGARETDPGMPSSHAQSLFFFATYLSLAALRAPELEATTRAAASLGLLGLATAGSVHRVKSGLHTPAQITVGAAVGSADAAVWLIWLQPMLADMLDAASLAAIAAIVVVAGALTVGSVERWLRKRGGLGSVLANNKQSPD